MCCVLGNRVWRAGDIRGKADKRRPNSTPGRVASRYLLSGVAKCGHCGKAPIGLEAKGGQLSYYVCGTLINRGAGSCQAWYVNSEKSEEVGNRQDKAACIGRAEFKAADSSG